MDRGDFAELNFLIACYPSLNAKISYGNLMWRDGLLEH